MELFCQLKASKARVTFLFFLVALCTGLSFETRAGDLEQEFLDACTAEINIAFEERFYQFSDLAFKKYCRTQYDELTTFLYDLYAGHTRFTLTELIGQKERFVVELMQECPNREKLIQLEYQFTELVANRSANLIRRLKGQLENSDLELEFEEKERLLKQVLEVEIQMNFKAEKILEELTSDDGMQSQINLKYLEKETGVISGANLIDSALLAELNQLAKTKVQKKRNQCAADGCKKKLGLIPFHCNCGESYCAKHREAEEHQCTFDYHAKQQEELVKKLPKIEADRIPNRI
jgi:hypothetical protein